MREQGQPGDRMISWDAEPTPREDLEKASAQIQANIGMAPIAADVIATSLRTARVQTLGEIARVRELTFEEKDELRELIRQTPDHLLLATLDLLAAALRCDG